jgi:hypothetical protein
MRHSRKRRTLIAHAGWILPVYHENEAETDLKPVGDTDGMLILNGLIPALGKFALARTLHMQSRFP